ncbi:MAG: hypothetical protein K6F47_07525 [Bacteroidaceae bacterium]|nr:hypothetical protein [Bacteroidaceae bacterium]
MKKNRISEVMLLIFSVIVLIFSNAVTYVLLLSKNEEWKAVVTEKDNNTFELTEALAEHVYYDGDSIPCNQTVRHYSRSGKLIESVELKDVLKGDKVVMLLSPNCCSACAKDEIEKLLNLSKKICRKHLVMMADFPMHMQSSFSLLYDDAGYYETDLENLGLEGTPTKETPVVMLTQNGRIKTSFVVRPQTSDFVDRFHEYLIEYFKGKK